MSGWAVTCRARVAAGRGRAADSADCCMICLVCPAQTAGSVHISRQSSPQHSRSLLIGCQDLMRGCDWLHVITAGSTCLDLHSAGQGPGPVLCFAKQKTCPCQSLDNSSAPTNRRLKDSSMDKLEAHNALVVLKVHSRHCKNPLFTLN